MTEPESDAPPPKPPAKSLVKRLLLATASVLLLAVFAMIALLFGFQRRLIFHPHPDKPAPHAGRYQTVKFHTADGDQTAYYLAEGKDPVRTKSVPSKLVVFFHGNGSVALNWTPILDEIDETSRPACLLVDYPGYGSSQGSPSRVSILRTIDACLPALAQHLQCSVADLQRNLHVVGLSMGTAAGLEFAVRQPVRSVTLFAPFTSLKAMAKLVVGNLFSNLLIDRFDNDARLAELAQRTPPPPVVIYHGTHDHVVPYTQGKELATKYAAFTQLITLPGDGHGFQTPWPDFQKKLTGGGHPARPEVWTN